MKTLAIIPARGGSKGIKKKNLLKIKDKHLFELCIDCAKNAEIDYVVSTDDLDIVSICQKRAFNFDVRPKELAADDTPMADVVRYIANSYSCYDNFLILQPTSPLRIPRDILEALELLRTNSDLDSVVSVTPLEHKFFPEKIMQLEGNRVVGGLSFNNRQDLEGKYFYRNGMIYLSRRENLKHGLIVGNVGYVITDRSRSIDIDNELDYEIARWMMEKKFT